VLVPTQNFRSRDGWVSLFVGNDPMWKRAKSVLQVPELDDPRFDSVAGRAAHKQDVLDFVGRKLLDDTTAGWVARLEAAGVPCAPVNDVPAALEDPQVVARGAVVEIEHPRLGTVREVASPLRVGDEERPIRRGPFRGEHTREVLEELCGYSRERIDELATAGAFGDRV